MCLKHIVYVCSCPYFSSIGYPHLLDAVTWCRPECYKVPVEHQLHCNCEVSQTLNCRWKRKTLKNQGELYILWLWQCNKKQRLCVAWKYQMFTWYVTLWAPWVPYYLFKKWLCNARQMWVLASLSLQVMVCKYICLKFHNIIIICCCVTISSSRAYDWLYIAFIWISAKLSDLCWDTILSTPLLFT